MSSLSIQDVKKQHEDMLMKIPDVSGVGLGIENDEHVIVVLVSKKSKRTIKRIPLQLEGFRIVLRETGPIRAF